MATAEARDALDGSVAAIESPGPQRPGAAVFTQVNDPDETSALVAK
jgi:hypothetical protein